VFTAAILILISIIDIKYRRIPNSFVLLLVTVQIFFTTPRWDPFFLIASSVSIATFAALTGCGFGDVKLSLVIVNLIIGRSEILEYLTYLLAISSISIAIHLLRYRTVKGEIAFAPALCGAVLAVGPDRFI